jgi:predicted ATPase
MIQNINIENYKAFQTAKIPLKPITILLGANSVGKSSIIQLMLMLQQTGKTGLKSYKSPLKLYGGYVNLGDSINLFRNKKSDLPLKFGFEIKSARLKEFTKDSLLFNYKRIFMDLPHFIPIVGFKEIKNKTIENLNDFELYVDSILDISTNQKTQGQYVENINFMLNHRSAFKIPAINKNLKKQLISTFKFLDSLAKIIKNELFDVNFELVHKEGILLTNLIELKHNNKIILKLNVDNENKISLISDLIKFDKNDIEQVTKYFDSSNTIFNSFNDTDIETKENNETVLSSTLIQIFRNFQDEIRKEFIEESINYVSPLRAHPKRYYMLDKAKLNLTLDTLDGDAIAEVIKDDSKIKLRVNNWFKKFGIQVNVEEFKEVIHHLKVKQNELDLDITDVGFGISQVLPVIIQGFLSSDNSTTIIEQPEIHLHPRIQADLADLFIDIVKNSPGKKLIIETHSEYILKRLRRRISEGKILPSQVAICLINPQSNGNGAIVNTLKIEDKGFFEWPIDFYGGDLYDDTVEFLKNQN